MYAIVDIESTGGKYNQESIIEIAIYRFDGLEVVDKLVSLVNPSCLVQPFVEKLTGITTNMLKRAPKFHQIAKRIIEITQDAVIVAHNAKFDYRMLWLEYNRLGYDYERKIICTEKLSRKLIPSQPSYTLDKLSKSLGVVITNRHRADGDAQATVKLFKTLLSKDTEKIIVGANMEMNLKKESSGKYLKILDKLPSKPGIYYIYDDSDKIIYINKASNIRNRVNQHFIGQSSTNKRIQEMVVKVSYEKTGNTLIAEIKLKEEILRLEPELNFRQDPQSDTTPKFSYPAQSIAIVLKGRSAHERSVVVIREGVVKGYGYYDLNIQLQPDILDKIITPISSPQAIKIVEKYLSKKPPLKIINL